MHLDAAFLKFGDEGSGVNTYPGFAGLPDEAIVAG
jgi:hypothetical protein